MATKTKKSKKTAEVVKVVEHEVRVLDKKIRLGVTTIGSGMSSLYGLSPLGKINSEVQSANGEDPFSKYYGDEGIVPPPYNPLFLSRMKEQSDVLRQCIEAMQINVGGFGFDLVRAEWMDPNEEKPKGADEEKNRLLTFLKHPNPDENITMLRSRHRDDLESTGNSYWEVIRNRAGEIAEIYLLPSHTMRITTPDKTETEFEQVVRDNAGAFIEIPRKKKFRRFVQIVDGGNKKIWFKEFGDPRNISKRDGKEGGGGTATEVLHFKIPCNYSVYGLPRWLGNLVELFGSRKASEVNFLFFDNKMIPPMAVLVSGGGLTEEAMETLRDTFEHKIKGVENFHKAIVLEAIPASVSQIEGEKISPVKIQLIPLTQFIQNDATFSEYRKDNRNTLRSTFRLPPIYVGLTEDYTRATADESARVAEEQVFSPARTQEDYIVTTTIFYNLRINYWDFKSLGGKTTHFTEVMNALSGVKEAIPIGILQEVAADVINRPRWPIDKSLYSKTILDHQSEQADKQIQSSEKINTERTKNQNSQPSSKE